MKLYDVVIIGGGIVGLSAGIYCGRLNLKTIIFAKELRGTLVKTHVVENYPGFKSISGFDLTGKVLEQAKQYNIEIISKEVIDVKRRKGYFDVFTRNSKVRAKNIIFATGTEWRKLDVPGEGEFLNKGVHYCALCDGVFYKNKIIAVVGGGDSAAKEALLLSEYGKKVYILARSTLKAEPINAERIKKNKKIQVIEGVKVKEIKGDKENKKVNELILTKKISGSNRLKVDGVFIDIGHIPKSELAQKLGVKLNEKKEIIIDKESKTNVCGVYAAGDVADAKFKQAVTGIGEGIKAVYNIYERLKKDIECM